jgi:molybdate transport system regulatory protein
MPCAGAINPATYPRLSLRVEINSDVRLGPGKVSLLERIRETGSISAAGRAMGMSYRRAWLLVDSLNRGFRQAVVTTRHGGRRGGGAELTAFGQELILRYRRMQSAAEQAVAGELAALERAACDSDGRS